MKKASVKIDWVVVGDNLTSLQSKLYGQFELAKHGFSQSR
jgi:hypothetical protein